MNGPATDVATGQTCTKTSARVHMLSSLGKHTNA
eukprot:CAMPEP_0174379226 /NCGR_PEP_ID=MMETSP0811_2-20130205/122563_1 /TAXON_ID=73025 ORGANISM="Eutreptiella gymnastica-like, Strain CCMP1594" /NCGR_SAMPLE_ID=MMETSP0811_2 /ASSEMBLY_ACC=CAM_ASM_000667 /LENGTH=33 /DNA_ID= /DNA_START= /DNA_END= /DNA_ORIENTATION=